MSGVALRRFPLCVLLIQNGASIGLCVTFHVHGFVLAVGKQTTDPYTRLPTKETRSDLTSSSHGSILHAAVLLSTLCHRPVIASLCLSAAGLAEVDQSILAL